MPEVEQHQEMEQLFGFQEMEAIIVGTDTGNAIENENKARKQYKEKDQVGESPLRRANPKHKEKEITR